MYYRRRQTQPKTFDPRILIHPRQPLPAAPEYPIKHRFSDFHLHQTINDNIVRRGYPAPTPIQDQVIKPIMAGKDVVGVSQTGTGKTAGFLLPLIDKLTRSGTSRVLVITPIRELAVQIRDEFAEFARGLDLASALIIGGVNLDRQVRSLTRRPAIVIGTPGRLKDLARRRKINLNEFSVVVLDEVDRMLDMGFIRDVKDLIGRLPRYRQSLFFSATIEGKAREVMQVFLHQPVIIRTQSQPITAKVNQTIVNLNGRNKITVLAELLRRPGYDKVLVFGRTKWGIEKLNHELSRRGLRALTIHSNKNQNQRQRALNQFKAGQVKILLATDVAQRGLDIDSVSHVINYDLPQTREDYIHRIGRTGRANKTGVAITLI